MLCYLSGEKIVLLFALLALQQMSAPFEPNNEGFDADSSAT